MRMQGRPVRIADIRRHLDAAGPACGDGDRFHLLAYIRWLAQTVAGTQPTGGEYLSARHRIAERSRLQTRAGQDIYPIPDVVNWERRSLCATSFRLFAETYFHDVFHHPWAPMHLRTIEAIERAVLDGGLFACALPRGGGKTALMRVAALWVALFGYHPFICLIGASQTRALGLLAPLRLAVLRNRLLTGDFPEAFYALTALENSAKRQGQQHVRGELTHVLWAPERIVFPWLSESNWPSAFKSRGLRPPACGAVIGVTSLDSHIRGQDHPRPDGTIVRPSLVFIDDPQTRESASSATQTAYRLSLLRGDVMGMAPPDRQMSAIAAVTRIYAGDLADQLLDPALSPEWTAFCSGFFVSMPTNMERWDQHGRVLMSHGPAAAKKFYSLHRAEMDEGAQVAWPEAYDRTKEGSAVEHGMVRRFRMKEVAFRAEYQNECAPESDEPTSRRLTVPEICTRGNGYPRGYVPAGAVKITGFIDVHDSVLYWMICAWEVNFKGYIIDYGTWPDQGRTDFTLDDPPMSLTRAYPGLGVEGAIHAGLTDLAKNLMARELPHGAGHAQVDRLLVDSGYQAGIVASVRRTLGSPTLTLSRGMGISATRKPMSAYRRRAGEVHGHHWFQPSVAKTAEYGHVLIDVNWWKSSVMGWLREPPGSPGALTFWGTTPSDHEALASHFLTEVGITAHALGRTVTEWRLKVGGSDNHWWDCLVGCAAAANMVGISAPGMLCPPTRSVVAPGSLKRRRP